MGMRCADKYDSGWPRKKYKALKRRDPANFRSIQRNHLASLSLSLEEQLDPYESLEYMSDAGEDRTPFGGQADN